MGGGSGTFAGHAIPATFFTGFGSFFLALTLKRCRELNSTGDRHTFCDVHVPEANVLVLNRTGVLLMIFTAIGMGYEAFGGMYDGVGFFHQLAHQALYLCFFFVGAVAYLEAHKRLVPDASRAALSLAFLMQYVLWNEHGLMKNDPGDARVHILQAQVNLCAAIAFGYSVYNTKSMLAHLSGWSLMVLNGLWMLTAGLNVCCVDLMRHTVGAALSLEALLVTAIVTVASAFCARNEERLHAAQQGEQVGSNEKASLILDDA